MIDSHAEPLLMDAGAVAPENYNERGYLAANPDIARGVAGGLIQNGRQHYDIYGVTEGRRLRHTDVLDAMRLEKAKRIEPILRTDMPFERRDLKFDFLTPELRAAMKISETENISASDYDEVTRHRLVNEFKDSLVLDCGCGKRGTYFPNVINYEIVDYDTTDVIGVGERLPFKDGSFDCVLSVAVLEHVYDPFRCAEEIVRVIKPGGLAIVNAPFLQPVHGYPHHYFNMTALGLSSLFERNGMRVASQFIPNGGHPLFTLNWILNSWAAGLAPEVREQFLSLPLRSLTQDVSLLAGEPWASTLPEEKMFELASGTAIFAYKIQGA